MSIKKFSACCCTLALIFSFAACGDEKSSTDDLVIATIDSADSSTKSPLSDMEYPELAIDKNTSFDEVMTTLLEDYIEAINNYSAYTEEHYYELSLGKQVCSIPDYKETFECWYQWFYKINSVKDEDIPEEYKSVWENFKSMASYDKPYIDNVYTSDFEALSSNMNEVFAYNAIVIQSVQDSLNEIQ